MLETARPLTVPSSLMIYESSLHLWGGSSFSIVKTDSDKANLQSPLTKCTELLLKKFSFAFSICIHWPVGILDKIKTDTRHFLSMNV